MAIQLDYYLSLNSPWTFLGSRRLEFLAKRHELEISVRPVDFSVIFPETGGQPLPKRAPARQAYRLVELERWREHLGIALNLHPAHFPHPERQSALAVYAAEVSGGNPLALAHAVLRALWMQERNPGEDSTLAELAEETGHDGAEILALSREQAAEDLLHRRTQQALEAGVFGAPSYVVDGEIFWGQDRIEFLDRKLSRL